MPRQLVSVRTVSKLVPISGADRVELAWVDGWRAVVLKGQFTAGDSVVFIETDAAIQAVDDPRFAFLRKGCLKQWRDKDVVIGQCLRIRTIRLAGQISQGVVLPVADFAEELSRDDSLESLLNVVHFDDLREEMTVKLGNRVATETKGSFPSFVPKTDEERIQNLPTIFDEHRNTLFEVTLKLDGCSMSVGYSPTYYPDDPYFVCKRSLRLRDIGDRFNEAAKKLLLPDALKALCERTGEELCLQGELIGPGIESNRGKVTEDSFNVFRCWSITRGAWLPVQEWRILCSAWGVPTVPLIEEAFPALSVYPTVDSLVEWASGATRNGLPAEGYILKSLDGETHFKVLNPIYLLKAD